MQEHELVGVGHSDMVPDLIYLPVCDGSCVGNDGRLLQVSYIGIGIGKLGAGFLHRSSISRV
jgi:hypothetical protein